MSEYGSLFSPHQIEEGVLSALQRRIPSYADEALTQHGVKLPEIQSWGLVDEQAERWPEQKLPALIVVAGGTAKGGDPEEYAGGWYRAGWSLAIVVVVEHSSVVEARRIAQVYGAVVRGALLQKRSLGGSGRVARWTGELNPFEKAAKATRAASENFFLVTQDEVVNWQLGPKTADPTDSPPGLDPEITEVNVDVEVE
jgi:hypothetical protein